MKRTDAMIQVGGRLVPCDYYKAEGSEKMMAMYDRLPPELRALVGEFNLKFVWDRRGMPAARIVQEYRAAHPGWRPAA